MTFLRRVLPKSWFTDVDYDRREDIDWRDAWDPSVHPRLPGGTEHGGEFTSGGGGAGGGLGISSGLPSGGFSTASHTNVPTPKAAVVQKHGGAKKLASLVAKHLQTGEDPHLTAQAIKAYGNAYVNAGYASYANALLSHVEQAHGMAAGTLGKAKAAAPMGKGGPPPQGAPSAAEMAAMHAAAEADEPAPDEDEWDEPSPDVQLGNTAAGTDPAKLQAIAGDPAALNELSDSAHKLGITVMGHVTKEAKAAKSEVGTWTDPSGYKMIQNHLNGVQTSPHAAEVADKLQKAILSTELLSPVNTYRGVHGPQLDMINAMQPGEVWTQKGFAGSTLDPKRATHYAKGGQGGDMIHMVLPKGSKALYVSNPALNSWEAEREMLLPAGSTFKYIGKTTINLPQYDYSGNKVGEGGPVTLHQVEVMQPGSPEFEAAHPRGEGGKFVAKPGAEAEADAKAIAATPPKPAAHQGVDTLAEAPGLSLADKIAGIKNYMMTTQSLAPESAHEYAAAKIAELVTQQKAEQAQSFAGTVPASAVENIAQSTATNHNQKLQILNELKAKAVELNHDPTQIDLGISMLEQKQKDFELSLPMPDGTAVQQEMWEVAANPGFKHETKIAQVQSDIDSMKEGPAKEYNKQLLAHLKGETYTPSAPAPQGPDPYPGSKGQQAIYEYATHPDPGVTVAEKISGIKSVMAHPNAGPMTQEFGEKWIAALDPSQAATPAAAPTPAPAPAPTPTPAAKPWASLETINNVHGRAAKPPKNVIRGNKKLARIQNAYDWEAKSAQPPSTSTPEAQKIAPSIKKAFWNKVDGGVKQSISLYGGSDYYPINGALRGDPNYPMTPKVQGWVNDMDALFYDDAAVTTEHMIVRRGEATPQADIDRWKIELAKGDKACLNYRSGYTSASVADESAFSSKPVQWHFVVPKGTRILGIAGTVGHHENEILFPHGQQTEIYEMWEADGQQHIKAILR